MRGELKANVPSYESLESVAPFYTIKLKDYNFVIQAESAFLGQLSYD